MTREDAIAILQHSREELDYPHGAYGIALEMAIQALEQTPCEDAISHVFTAMERIIREELKK